MRKGFPLKVPKHKTKRGLISNSYRHQIASSVKRGHVPPDYDKDELYDWVMDQPLFDLIYNNWVDSGFNTDLAPSIDRTLDSKPYSFSNIKLMTWQENREKSYADRANNPDHPSNKAVSQWTMEGDFVDTFESASVAGRETGISIMGIRNTRAGRNKSAGGFVWTYA